MLPYGDGNASSAPPMSTDIFAGIGGAPLEEEKKETLEISEDHYQQRLNDS